MLRSDHDIEDVLQATYLVLAQDCRIPWHESVGSWLCAVAHRLAIHARADATRQERREISFAQLDVTNSGWHGEETAGRLRKGITRWRIPRPKSSTAICAGLWTTNFFNSPRSTEASGPVRSGGSNPSRGSRVLGWPSGSISHGSNGRRPLAATVGPPRRDPDDRPCRNHPRRHRRLPGDASARSAELGGSSNHDPAQTVLGRHRSGYRHRRHHSSQ